MIKCFVFAICSLPLACSNDSANEPADAPAVAVIDARVQEIVGACDHLAAPGVWEEISPVPGYMPHPDNEGKWGAAAVVTHPALHGTIYASVGYMGVWKSTDCGSTWVKLNTGRHGTDLDTGIQFDLHVVPGQGAEPDLLYANNWIGVIPAFFKSTNGGVDWDPLYDKSSNVEALVELGGWGNQMGVDPADARHLIIDFHANCKSPRIALCMGESTDGGATWRLFDGPQRDGLKGWQEAAVPYFVTPTHWIYAAHAGIFSTTNSGATWTFVRYPGGTWHLETAGMYYIAGDDGVLASADGGSWTPLAGSHASNAIVATGKEIYTGSQFDSVGTLWRASQSNPTSWTAVPMPTAGKNAGATSLAYDGAHRVLYSSNHRSGLWRMVIE